MKKILLILCMAAVSAMAVKATRIGPVSTYGELKANGGKLSGSCSAYANKTVQVKGMSLFWSSAADSALVYYTSQAMGLMVNNMGIEVLRFALGVGDEKFDSHGRSYTTGGANDQKAMVKKMVYAAVENDIYIILDWHTEGGNGYTSQAKEFFSWAAQEFGKVNNVIFEIWNEPNGVDMSAVKNHADQVIPVIRQHSNNLILVGSPDWSSHPDQCANAGITDANYGCSLHFYAATGAHQVNDNNDDSYNNRARKAIQKGVPVFATEWGTVSADGNGSPDKDHSQAWVNWMNQNGVSWANWSASAINEGSAAFSTLTLNQGLQYTTSGSMVKGFLAGSHNYSDCGLENSIGSSSGDDGFSAGVANGATTDIIDDMEDGDRYTYSGGFWSAWADSDDDTDGRGATKISNKKYTNDFNKETYDVIIKAKEGNDSKYMAGMEGIYIDQGSYKWAPYVAMGLNLTKDTSEFSQLANCKTISYKYKGAAHNFRVEISPITNYNFHYVDAEASSEWRTVELTMDMFQQHTTWSNPQIMDLSKNLGKTKRLAWEVNGVVDRPASEIQPLYNYLYVDDVRCDGISFKATSGNSASNSSSSTGKSSSSQGGKSSSSLGGNSSSSEAPTSSSSVGVVLKEIVLIDDVEDADEVLKTGGTWYAYNDSTVGGLSTISNVYDASLPGYVVTFAGTEDPTNGTQGFVGLNGIEIDPGTYEERPFVALGLNTNSDTSKGIDLSACTAISYRYKGAAHDFKLQDGQVLDFDYHLYKTSSSTEWKEVIYSFDEILQMGWGEPVDLNYTNIKKMAWEVLGWKKSKTQPELDYLYVDDVKCVGSGTDGVRLARKAASSLKLSVNGNVLNVVTAASASIQVFDMMGNLVMSRVENAAGDHQVSFEGVNRGNYVVRVKSAGAAQTARISIR